VKENRMPWGSSGEELRDRVAGLKDAADEAKQGNLKDAAGLVKQALTGKVDPDARIDD
jgi:hypothetical protein